MFYSYESGTKQFKKNLVVTDCKLLLINYTKIQDMVLLVS